MKWGDATNGLEPLEWAALAMVGLVAGAALALTLLAGLAAALFGDGWVAVPLADMPGVLARLPETIGDPRQAWPAPVRQSLPGLGGFLATALIVGATIVLLGLRLAGHLSRPQGRPARWAKRRDLHALRVRRATRGRVILGRHGRTLVAAEPRQSVLVVAPTQTGKTTGLAVPAILEWEVPVLATSVKTDLVRDTVKHRESVGDVKIFDPAAATGLPRAHWTPLAGCGIWEGARRTADRLAKAAQSAPRSGQDGEFWGQAGARLLAPLLFAAALTDRSILDVTRWIDAEEHEEVLDALGEHEAAKNAAIAVWGADDRLRSSLYMTATIALDAYNDPAVVACSERAELTANWLLDRTANTAYLCAPVDEQARLRPLFATLVREVIGEVYARAGRSGKPIERPLLVVLDEAANIAPLPDLDQIASTGAGQGIQLVTVFQDLAQIHLRWGAKADTIVNNHRAKLFGPGISCARTLEYLRRILGDTELQQRSQTSAEQGRRSTTRSTTFRPLAPPNMLRERADGSMLLVYGALAPAILRTRPWFRDRRLRKRAKGQ
jgi:type IV secretion system protein VirD4